MQDMKISNEKQTKTIHNLLEAGYKKYDAGLASNWAQYLLQKRFNDKNGVKYFITIYVSEIQGRIGVTGTMQTCRGLDTVNIKLLHVESVKAVENLFEEFWIKLNMNHYEKQ